MNLKIEKVDFVRNSLLTLPVFKYINPPPPQKKKKKKKIRLTSEDAKSKMTAFIFFIFNISQSTNIANGHLIPSCRGFQVWRIHFWY